MKTSFRLLFVFIACLFGASMSVDAKIPAPIKGAIEYRNVRYLPDWRYSTGTATEGEETSPRDGQMVMDIVVPEDGKELHPVLFVVHGGGWSAGTKDEKGYREIMAYFSQRGYVTVGFNYILRPRGMFPQVFWDYETAARFLRENAEQYKIDPTKFGAMGLSAGGWLITSAGHGSGDLFLRNHQHSTHIARLWELGWQAGGRLYEDTFLRPMVSPEPVYPDAYGRFQAISYDFDFRTAEGTGNSPATNQWAGEGYTLRPDEQAAVESGRFDHSQTVLTHPDYKGQKVHVPPLFESIQKDGSDKAQAIGIDGTSRVPAIERIYQFFQHQLVENPRTPTPEFRPTTRFFEERAEVSLVLPMEGAEVRYQVLPLKQEKGKRWWETIPAVEEEAWKGWERYDGSIAITQSSLVRAVAMSDGRRPSTVAEAHFFEGVEVAKVTAPDAKELPAGTTGKAYKVTFEADVESPRWFLAGDLVPYTDRKDAAYTYPNGMVFDTRTGQWSGTPTRPGRYWVQVWVNEKPGTVAAYRDYTWTVTGDDLSDEPERVAELTDPYAELVWLTDPRHPKPGAIGDLLNEHGIPQVIQEEKEGTLVLVRKEHREEAKRVLTAWLEEINFKGEANWK